MPPLSTHLARLTETVAQAHKLPNILADFAHLPPGGSDEAEAHALAAALDALNVHRDGTTQDPTAGPADVLAEALRSAAEPAALSLRSAARAILVRLDHLAAR